MQQYPSYHDEDNVPDKITHLSCHSALSMQDGMNSRTAVFHCSEVSWCLYVLVQAPFLQRKSACEQELAGNCKCVKAFNNSIINMTIWLHLPQRLNCYGGLVLEHFELLLYFS